MKCESCGTDNKNGSKFCKSCGAKIASTTISPAAETSKGKGKGLIIGGALAVIAIAVAAFLFFPTGKIKTVHAKNGEVRISQSEVSDGKAHFYEIQSGGKVTRFFLLKASDGVVRAALDACDVCFQAKQGYRQEAAGMVCNNCGNVFPAEQINAAKGGCNPVPLTRRTDGGDIVLDEAELVRLNTYF